MFQADAEYNTKTMRIVIVVTTCVMYTVLSSLAACGRLGVAAAAAGVFVCHA